jgi:hypothetical protein
VEAREKLAFDSLTIFSITMLLKKNSTTGQKHAIQHKFPLLCCKTYFWMLEGEK